MQLAVQSQALNRRDVAAFSAKRRNQTAMNGSAVEPDRAGAAVAGVAAFFDSEPSHLAQESSQALSRARLFRERFAIYQVTHAGSFLEISRRISSAKWKVMCLRYSGV